MAIVNAANVTAAGLMQSLRQALRNHQRALEVIEETYAWAAGISAADLEAMPPNGPGMTSADAMAFLTAVNDAHAEYLLHTTGLPPGTYPQPPSAYVYAASQNALMGPP